MLLPKISEFRSLNDNPVYSLNITSRFCRVCKQSIFFTQAIVYMYGVEDLCTGANEGEKSERKTLIVDGQSAGTVTFPVIPLKDGTFHLKVVALSPEGSDVIMKTLNVVVSCFYLVSILLIKVYCKENLLLCTIYVHLLFYCIIL